MLVRCFGDLGHEVTYSAEEAIKVQVCRLHELDSCHFGLSPVLIQTDSVTTRIGILGHRNAGETDSRASR